MTLTPIGIFYENDDVEPIVINSNSIKARIDEWNCTHKSKMSFNKDGSIDIFINWISFLRGKL